MNVRDIAYRYVLYSTQNSPWKRQVVVGAMMLATFAVPVLIGNWCAARFFPSKEVTVTITKVEQPNGGLLIQLGSLAVGVGVMMFFVNKQVKIKPDKCPSCQANLFLQIGSVVRQAQCKKCGHQFDPAPEA